MKSFKQFITESIVDCGHGIKSDGDNFFLSHEGYNWLKGLGVLFKVEDQPNQNFKDKSPSDYGNDYHKITIEELARKLNEEYILFIDNENKLPTNMFRLIRPKQRQEIQNLFTKAGSSYTMKMDDTKLIKLFGDDSFYQYP